MAVDVRSLITPVAIRGMLAREWYRSRVTFNPLAHSFQQDPYPTYARLRRKDRVHWSYLLKGWVLSWYEDVDLVLRDHRRFASDERNAREGAPIQTELGTDGRTLLALDPPDHTRLRGLVSKVFTTRRVDVLEPRIREIVDGVLDEVEDGATIDVMEVLGYPLPVTVIAELIGVPAEDRAQFKAWSDAIARTLEPTISGEELAAAETAAAELDEYFLAILPERRRQPREDLLSALITAEEAGDQLSEREMLNTLRLLLVAGNETTTNLVGMGMLALLRHPEQLRLLRDDRSLMERAIEELLRYDSPVQTDARTALVDVEIGGTQIRRGEAVYTLIGSANRDPRQFERPRELDIRRGDGSHLSFGRGIHHCLGAPLARLEGRIAFEGLLDAFPRMELAEDVPVFKDNVVLRGAERLMVRVHRA